MNDFKPVVAVIYSESNDLGFICHKLFVEKYNDKPISVRNRADILNRKGIRDDYF